MNRIELVFNYMNEMLTTRRNDPDRNFGFIHLFGVSQACSLLAMKRGEDVELACIAGMLHDVFRYKTGHAYEHAHQGAVLAKEILESFEGAFSEEEIRKITQAIYRHSDKDRVDTALDEILKDADVMQHCLLDPLEAVAPYERERYERLKAELGLQDGPRR